MTTCLRRRSRILWAGTVSCYFFIASCFFLSLWICFFLSLSDVILFLSLLPFCALTQLYFNSSSWILHAFRIPWMLPVFLIIIFISLPSGSSIFHYLVSFLYSLFVRLWVPINLAFFLLLVRTIFPPFILSNLLSCMSFFPFSSA